MSWIKDQVWIWLACLPFLLRAWKRGQFCPECNVVFGMEKDKTAAKPKHFGRPRKQQDGEDDDGLYAYCWVCSRQHHSACVGQALFICAGCQKRTQERYVGGGITAGIATHVGVNGGGGLVNGGGGIVDRPRRSMAAAAGS